MTTVKAIFEGRVQDVGFRNEARAIAKLHSINGYVKNKKDGTVEAVFQGEEEMVNKVIRNLKKGVELAEVTSISITEIHKPIEFTDFKIEY